MENEYEIISNEITIIVVLEMWIVHHNILLFFFPTMCLAPFDIILMVGYILLQSHVTRLSI